MKQVEPPIDNRSPQFIRVNTVRLHFPCVVINTKCTEQQPKPEVVPTTEKNTCPRRDNNSVRMDPRKSKGLKGVFRKKNESPRNSVSSPPSFLINKHNP